MRASDSRLDRSPQPAVRPRRRFRPSDVGMSPLRLSLSPENAFQESAFLEGDGSGIPTGNSTTAGSLSGSPDPSRETSR